MNARKVLLGVCLFAGGAIAGSLYRPTPREDHREVGVTRIMELHDSEDAPLAPSVVDVVPFRFEEDGRAREIADAPRYERQWLIVVDGGRFRVFGTSR